MGVNESFLALFTRLWGLGIFSPDLRQSCH